MRRTARTFDSRRALLLPDVDPSRMVYLLNLTLLLAEAVLYFTVMAVLFRMRRRFGIGIFFCALGTMHFLETYLASILYLQFPLGITISPGSAVLFSGKLVMLLLVYIREDAAAVRQPIYGLLFGNFLMVGLVTFLRFHDITPAVPDQLPDFQFMREMGWLMLWGTLLL
jgi:vitamin uptake sensor VUPS-like protein